MPGACKRFYVIQFLLEPFELADLSSGVGEGAKEENIRRFK